MDTQCIFCNIVKGDIPSVKIYEDEKMIAINDVNLESPIHVLLIPKKHFQNVLLIDKDILAHMLDKVSEITQKLGVAENGFRLVINTGKDGGQTVDHLHIHLLGGRNLLWPPG